MLSGMRMGIRMHQHLFEAEYKPVEQRCAIRNIDDESIVRREIAGEGSEDVRFAISHCTVNVELQRAEKTSRVDFVDDTRELFATDVCEVARFIKMESFSLIRVEEAWKGKCAML